MVLEPFGLFRHNAMMLRSTSKTAFAALVVLFLSGAPATLGDDKPRDEDAVRKEVLEELYSAHNEVRKAEGKKPFERNRKLDEAALAHAQDMAKRETMSHEGEDGSHPGDRIRKAGYNYRRVAENIAFNRKSAKETVGLWMESSTHRPHILGNYADVGMGFADAKDGRRYWCVDFGVKKAK